MRSVKALWFSYDAKASRGASISSCICTRAVGEEREREGLFFFCPPLALHVTHVAVAQEQEVEKRREEMHSEKEEEKGESGEDFLNHPPTCFLRPRPRKEGDWEEDWEVRTYIVLLVQ